VIQRNGLALDQIEAILDAQATREERLAQADDVIDNAGSPAASTDTPTRRPGMLRSSPERTAR
jgi:dephospho-CoA kinase